MTSDEVEARFQRIETLLAETAASQARTEANLAKTEAIANSNARAILANTEADRQQREASAALNAKLDRLADLVERYIIATQIRQDASDICVESLENRVSDLENQ